MAAQRSHGGRAGLKEILSFLKALPQRRVPSTAFLQKTLKQHFKGKENITNQSSKSLKKTVKKLSSMFKKTSH